MGDGELAAIARELEREICRNSSICQREMDARISGS